MPTPRPRNLELYLLLAAVLVLAGVEWLGHRSTTEATSSARWVAHTHEVIARLDDLLVAAIDAETGRRGFALTGDEAQLVPYRDAAARAARHMDDLRALTADNARQRARLDALEPKLEARLAFLDAAVAERRGGFDVSREASRTVEGNVLSLAVRAAIAEMSSEEHRLLREREGATLAMVERTRFMQFFGGVLSIGLFAFATLRLRAEVVRRRTSEWRARLDERSLATTLYSIGEAFLAVDEKGAVTRMNANAEALTGFSIDEARGRPHEEIFRLVREGTGKASPSPFVTALAGKASEPVDDAVLLAKDGTKRRITEVAAPIRDADDRVLGAVLVFRDIGKTLDDARALRRANRFLDSIVENLPNMIFVKDAHELAFVRMNKAGEELLGMKRDELLGKTDFAFFPVDQAKNFVDKDREVLRGRTLVDIPEEPLTTSRGVRWLHTRKVPILDDDGEPEYLLGISEDITDQRRMAAELQLALARAKGEA